MGRSCRGFSYKRSTLVLVFLLLVSVFLQSMLLHLDVSGGLFFLKVFGALRGHSFEADAFLNFPAEQTDISFYAPYRRPLGRCRRQRLNFYSFFAALVAGTLLWDFWKGGNYVDVLSITVDISFPHVDILAFVSQLKHLAELFDLPWHLGWPTVLPLAISWGCIGLEYLQKWWLAYGRQISGTAVTAAKVLLPSKAISEIGRDQDEDEDDDEEEFNDDQGGSPGASPGRSPSHNQAWGRAFHESPQSHGRHIRPRATSSPRGPGGRDLYPRQPQPRTKARIVL